MAEPTSEIEFERWAELEDVSPILIERVPRFGLDVAIVVSM